jgi:hypothetical protein
LPGEELVFDLSPHRVDIPDMELGALDLRREHLLLDPLVLFVIRGQVFDLAPERAVLHVHLGGGHVAGNLVHCEHVLEQLHKFLFVLENRQVVHRRLLGLRNR